jgi:hypothetical protein
MNERTRSRGATGVCMFWIKNRNYPPKTIGRDTVVSSESISDRALRHRLEKNRSVEEKKTSAFTFGRVNIKNCFSVWENRPFNLSFGPTTY